MKFDAEITKRVRRLQDRNGEKYIKPGDHVYNVLKIFFYIAFIYNFIVSFMSALSYYMRNFHMIEPSDADLELLPSIMGNVIALCIFIALMIAALIVEMFKKHIALLVLCPLSSLPLMFIFYKMMSIYIEDNGITDYLIKHGLPLFIFFAVGLILGILGARADYKDKKAYLAYTDKDYEKQFDS